MADSSDESHRLHLHVTFSLFCRPISGGHYNPVFSLALTLRGGMPVPEMLSYWVAQFIGAIVGSLCGGIVGSSYATISIGADATLAQALLAEAVITFMLCFVALCVATNPKVEFDSNHHYGLAIGLVIVAGAISIGGISGGSFNPVVALSLSITSGMSKFFYALLISAANVVGGIVAVGCFRVVLPSAFNAGGTPKETVDETTPLQVY